MIGLYHRAATRARRSTELLVRTLVRQTAASAWSRPYLNAYYRRLDWTQRKRFQKRYAKLFRRTPTAAASGRWVNVFLGRRFHMPLTAEEFMLDWDRAVSILGNDTEVKITYAALMQSAEPPEVFLDVGANYGTHSLLFLLHNIRTLTFEPNQACHGYFLRLCAMNDVTPDLRGVAVGNQPGEVELVYPRLDTWLGSIVPGVVHSRAHSSDLVTQRVALHTLDAYLPLIEGKRTLIKIDTEGNERGVLQGASGILGRVRPLVIFESVKREERTDIHNEFASHGYAVHALPWSPRHPSDPLTVRELIDHPAINFIGIPR